VNILLPDKWAISQCILNIILNDYLNTHRLLWVKIIPNDRPKNNYIIFKSIINRTNEKEDWQTILWISGVTCSC